MSATTTSGAKPEPEIFKDVIQTQNGPVKGFIKNSRNSEAQYVAFMGLRYAEKSERFEIPRKLQETWTEPKVATKRGDVCFQVGVDLSPQGGEDCLFLNVNVPKKHLETGSSKLPVMFWVHGGGFAFGEGHTYGGEYFMEDGDVILVTVNYRLGFNFLSTEDGVIPGNIGLRDLVVALEWVRDNIAAFKGDPGNVTIFGESAGSASVHYLLMSRLTKGLFHRAIMQSGALSFWSYDLYPKKTAVKLAEHLNCDLPPESAKQSIAIRDCLKKIPTEELGKAHASFNPRWPLTNPISRALPTAVEPDENAFFSGTPQLFTTTGKKISDYPNKVPVIAGVCKNEGSLIFLAFVMAEEKLQELSNNWTEIAPKSFMYEDFFPKENLREVSIKIRDFYFGKDESLELEKKLLELEELYSDALFVLPVMNAAMEMAEKGFQVYPYVFSYHGARGIAGNLGLPETIPGAVGHADDIQYIFPHSYLGNKLGPKDEAFSKRLVKLWTTFAKTGKPELDKEWTQGKDVSWNTTSVKPSDITRKDDVPFEVLEINEQPKMINLDVAKKIKFWKELAEKYGFHKSKI